jgi:beta-lactamase class A
MNYFSLKFLLLLVATVSFTSACFPGLASTQKIQPAFIQKKLVELETSSGGRLGISAINTGNNQHIKYRAEERFPFCSTFKMMGAAAILKKSMVDTHLLQQKVKYQKEDIVLWSPITEKHIADGMTISELAGAAVTQSDSTAINLLVRKLGGPAAITAFAYSIGDNTFRLDRWEPELNAAIPGDIRDTTTPAAMAKSLRTLVLGNVLAPSQREQLKAWLKDNATGNFRIRAGTPQGWIVGDKTGGGGSYGITNDIGIIWPPHCPPIVVTIYLAQNKKDAARREDILASATRLIISEFGRTDPCIKLDS